MRMFARLGWTLGSSKVFSCPIETCWSLLVGAHWRWLCWAPPWTRLPLLRHDWCVRRAWETPVIFILPPPSHNLQVSVRDNLAGLSAFGHKGSSGLTYHYQCPACLGSIVQKTHFHLPLTIQKLICKSNGLHLSICPAAVYCVHVGKSTSEAFKWISVLCNAPSMNCSN